MTREDLRISSTHRRYLYRLPVNEEGITHSKVAVAYGLFQAVVGVSVLSVKPLGLIAVTLVLAAYSIGFFVFGSFVRRSVASLRFL